MEMSRDVKLVPNLCGFELVAELPPGARMMVYEGKLYVAGPEMPVSELVGDQLRAVHPLPDHDVEPKRLDEAILGFRLL